MSQGPRDSGNASILYWVWTADSEQFTTFQGFRRSHIECTAVLKHIATLPSSVFELFVEKPRIAFARMNGVSTYHIVLADQARLENLDLSATTTFNVFVSDSSTWKAVEAYEGRSACPLLHVTTAEQCHVPKLATLGRAELRQLYVRVLEFRERSGKPRLALLPSPKQECVDLDIEELGLPEREHGSTIPNEMALRSLGFRLGKLDALPSIVRTPDRSPSASVNSEIIRILHESVQEVRKQRTRFSSIHSGPPAGPPVDSVIWAAGINSHLPDDISPGVKAPEGVVRVLRALLRQRDYPAFTNLSVDDYKRTFASAEANAAVVMRKLELDLCTAALGVLAAGHFAPVIRVRPAVNFVKGQMKQIAACAAANSPRKIAKLSKLADALGAKFVAEVGTDCMQLIEQAGEGIKLVSNAPLEFLPLNGLPLQLRRTVSRLPVTPGEVFLSHLIGAPALYLSPSDLRTVLIVRSFDDDDPIKNTLSFVAKHFLDVASDKLDVRTVDVRSAEEFIEAVNSFSGHVMIFDGHGAHDVVAKTGSLQFGADSVHPLELASRIRRMPPIVILSACSTHPLDWSDGSTATGFLMLGAVSVLATVAPISGRDAAVFTGRFLLRLADFVPLIAGTGQRWTDVITGLLRMAYITDLLRSLEKRGWLSEAAYLEIHNQSNKAINSRQPDWFERVLTAISRKAGIPLAEVEHFWKHEAYFTSTLLYVHLGSPQQITIVED